MARLVCEDRGRRKGLPAETAFVRLGVGEADMAGEHRGADRVRDGVFILDDGVLPESEGGLRRGMAACQGRGRGDCERGDGRRTGEALRIGGDVDRHDGVPFGRVRVPNRGIHIGGCSAGCEPARDLRVGVGGLCRRYGRSRRDRTVSGRVVLASAGFPDGLYDASSAVTSPVRSGLLRREGVVG